MKGYGLNEEEKRYCKGTFDDIASEAKQAFENEQDPKLKAAAGVHALDKGIKSSVEFFGAAHSLGMKGEQGLDEYFKNDEEKKESFLKMTGMGREYEKLQAAEKQLMQKANSILQSNGYSHRHTETEQQVQKHQAKLKM